MAKKLKFSRKTLLSALAAVLVTALIVAASLLFVPLFQLANVEATGNAHTSAADIEAASGVISGTPLVRVDAESAARGVAALPWVAKVNVHRVFPDTLRIEIAEREAVMFTKRNDGEHLIDSTGRPFVIETPPPGSVEVTGQKEDDPDVLADVAEAITTLDPGARVQLERVDAKSKFEIRMFFTGGKEVYWGSVEQAHDKAKATSTVIQREGDRWNVSAPGMVVLIP